MCVTNFAWLHSENACETLKDDGEKGISFLESILGLRAHDNRSIVVQKCAKTQALSGLR